MELSKTILSKLERQRDEARLNGDIKRVNYYQRQIDQLREVIERAK